MVVDSMTNNDIVLKRWELRTLGAANSVILPDGCCDLNSRCAENQRSAWHVTSLDESALSELDLAAASVDRDKVRFGWGFSLGVEHKLNQNWSARADVVGYTFGD